MKLRTILQLIREDSIEQAIAANDYATSMLKNAKQKKLDSINYWADKTKAAQDRIQVLQNKGEKIDDDSINKATAIRNNAIEKVGIKSKKFKAIAKIFAKELTHHLTFKKIVHEVHHVYHNIAKPLAKSAHKFSKNPKAASIEAYDNSKDFLSRSIFAIKNVGQVAKNTIDMISNAKAKSKMQFTSEEKLLMKTDPDTFRTKLVNKLTPAEEKDVKTLSHAVATTAILATCGTFVGHTAHLAHGIGAALTQSTGKIVLESLIAEGTILMKTHILASLRDAAIQTAMIIHSGHLIPIHDDINDDENKIKHGDLMLSIYPFIKMFENEDLQTELINKFKDIILSE